MNSIKRVLWVDDYFDTTEAKELFPDDETNKLRTMAEAIDEISSSHLYDYDTIVFDIDFEKGLGDQEKVVRALTKHIYLDNEQCNNTFIIQNGGYLLYLYLLERGYPSDRVAFLTGNAGMIDALKKYARKNESFLTTQEIIQEYQRIWDNTESIDDFYNDIECMNAANEYTRFETAEKCAEYLENDDIESLIKCIEGIQLAANDNSSLGIENTGDIMIGRFHYANLEPPVFFSKNTSFPGHDRNDARQWLEDGRTENIRTRWLALYAGNYVKQLFEENWNVMNSKINEIFTTAGPAAGVPAPGDPVSEDRGIYSSFSQLYYIVYGMRDMDSGKKQNCETECSGEEQKEWEKREKDLRRLYCQAITALLVPFDQKPGEEGKTPDGSLDGNKVQKMFAWLSKQGRNYCAHNYFLSEVSNITVLFLITGALAAVLDKDGQKNIEDWFLRASEILLKNIGFNVSDNCRKIDDLCERLHNEHRFNVTRAGLRYPDRRIKRYDEFNTYDILSALGWNKQMELEQPTGPHDIKEKYLLFSLAAYVVKWFGAVGLTDESVIESDYGVGVKLMFKISNEIVKEYEYPHSPAAT